MKEIDDFWNLVPLVELWRRKIILVGFRLSWEQTVGLKVWPLTVLRRSLPEALVK